MGEGTQFLGESISLSLLKIEKFNFLESIFLDKQNYQ